MNLILDDRKRMKNSRINGVAVVLQRAEPLRVGARLLNQTRRGRTPPGTAATFSFLSVSRFVPQTTSSFPSLSAPHPPWFSFRGAGWTCSQAAGVLIKMNRESVSGPRAPDKCAWVFTPSRMVGAARPQPRSRCSRSPKNTHARTPPNGT